MTAVRSRRSFLGGLAAAPLLAAPRAASGAVPRRPGPKAPKIKLSCNIYSFNEPLTKGTMSLEEAFDFCAELGFDAVDPTGYYFPGYPEAPPDRYLYEIKKRAFRLGLDISGTGVRNDFAAPDPAKRAAAVGLVKRWIDVSVKLGAPAVRVFAGPAVAGRSATEATDQVVAHLEECVGYGADRGIFVVLQHHDDLLKTASETLAVLERVGSEWLGLNVDIGSLRTTDDPYAEIAALAPFAYTWQIKEQVYRKGVVEDVDLGKIVRILRDTGYRGYIPLETLGAGDPRPKLRLFLDRVRRALDA
ncbi:MAG TPA: sugar phosphate isomerase/epimerase family protein [Vicinamibacteria bacterium]